MPKGGVDTFLVDRQVIDLLVNLNQSNLPITEQILWIGYDFATVYYKRQKRTIGKSRWTLSKKIKMTFDSILGFSYLPIRFISTIGILSCALSFIWIVCLIIQKLTQQITIDGYTSIVAIILMAFGIIMFSIGIIGEYLWRTFDVSRRMPPFIIDEVKKSEKQQ